jgi:hypothetical protein
MLEVPALGLYKPGAGRRSLVDHHNRPGLAPAAFLAHGRQKRAADTLAAMGRRDGAGNLDLGAILQPGNTEQLVAPDAQHLVGLSGVQGILKLNSFSLIGLPNQFCCGIIGAAR